MSDAGDSAGEDDPRPGPSGPAAAHAVNWKTVLAVDALMGVAVVAAGIIAMVVWSVWLGALLAVAGGAYVALVVRRGDQWRRLRRDAGL